MSEPAKTKKERKPRKARDPNAPKKERAPRGPRSAEEKAIAIYLIEHDMTKAAFAKMLGTSAQRFAAILAEKLEPPRSWVGNPSVPEKLRQMSLDYHRANIESDYKALQAYLKADNGHETLIGADSEEVQRQNEAA